MLALVELARLRRATRSWCARFRRADLPHRLDDLLLSPRRRADDDGVPAVASLEQLDQDRSRGAIRDRREGYTKSLLDKGMPKILEKIAEESGELAAELPDGDEAKVVHETADLFFHVMVGLAARGGSRSSTCSTSCAPVRHERPRREGGAHANDRDRAGDLLAPGGGLDARDSRTTKTAPSSGDGRRRSRDALARRAAADRRGGHRHRQDARVSGAGDAVGQGVVVSTGTQALQEQIARQDMPLLRHDPRAAVHRGVLKGVANYVCRRRLAETR